MKAQADNHRRDVEFKVEDLVYVKLQLYRQLFVGRRVHHKLSPRCYRPFRILEWVGQVANHLDLTEGSKIHPTFHVSLLKAHHRLISPDTLQLPSEAVDHQPLIRPLVIVDHCRTQAGEKEVLVQWEGLLPQDATWESWAQLLVDYPELHLEDTVPFEGEKGDSNSYSIIKDQAIVDVRSSPLTGAYGVSKC